MQSDHLVRTEEDRAADEIVRRGRTAGSGWIVASGVSLAFALGVWTTVVNQIALVTSAVLLAVGIRSRRRFWQRAAREVGDATLQRARWRTLD